PTSTLSLYCTRHLQDLHSFPTRRSSDLSHNHYDHLDLPTLRRLAARGDSTFIVPAGVGRLLRSENIGPAHELDWGESLSLSEFTDRKSTRLNSSHDQISYAVFCLKKKKS